MSSSPGRGVGVILKAPATIAPRPCASVGGVAGSFGGGLGEGLGGGLAALPSGDTTGVSPEASTGAGTGGLGSCGVEACPGLANGDARNHFSRYQSRVEDKMDRTYDFQPAPCWMSQRSAVAQLRGWLLPSQQQG